MCTCTRTCTFHAHAHARLYTHRQPRAGPAIRVAASAKPRRAAACAPRVAACAPRVAACITYGCSVPLYLMGHSLGGSLALTLWGAALLPAAHTGRVTVVALGAPNQPVSDPEPDPSPNQAKTRAVPQNRALSQHRNLSRGRNRGGGLSRTLRPSPNQVALGAPAVHHGEVRLSAAQRRARVILLVNG